MITIKKKRVTKDKHGFSSMKEENSEAPGFQSSSESYESVKSFSESDLYRNFCLERAYSDGYEFAQKEFAKSAEPFDMGDAVKNNAEKKSRNPFKNIKLTSKQKNIIKKGGLGLLAAGALTGSVIEAKNLIQKHKEKKQSESSINREKSRFLN